MNYLPIKTETFYYQHLFDSEDNEKDIKNFSVHQKTDSFPSAPALYYFLFTIPFTVFMARFTTRIRSERIKISLNFAKC